MAKTYTFTEAQLIVPRTNERIDFNPAGTYLWFGSNGCEVYAA